MLDFFSVCILNDNCFSKSDFGTLILHCMLLFVVYVEHDQLYCFQ